MKATFFDGKKMILEKNYPDPDFNETLVHVDLAGICGTDLEILDGYMPVSYTHLTLPTKA